MTRSSRPTTRSPATCDDGVCHGGIQSSGENAQPLDHANLERKEGDDLRERDDAGGRQAGLEEGVERLWTGVARMKHEPVRCVSTEQ
jgi:hypothetical protein